MWTVKSEECFTAVYNNFSFLKKGLLLLVKQASFSWLITLEAFSGTKLSFFVFCVINRFPRSAHMHNFYAYFVSDISEYSLNIINPYILFISLHYHFEHKRKSTFNKHGCNFFKANLRFLIRNTHKLKKRS